MNDPSMVFVFPQYDDSKQNYIGTAHHLGTAYIRAYLAEKGFETAQFLSPPFLTLDQVVKQILAYRSPIVGFTCYDKSYYISKVISREIKKKNPDIKIVYGGPTSSSADRLIMEDNPDIDICVRHEGEETTYELINRWSKGDGIEDIAGITYRQNSKIKRNPDRPQLSGGEAGSELDFLPSPYINGMLPVREDKLINLVSARGCPFRCTFCNNSLMGLHKIRRHSIERVIAELKYIAASGEKLKALFVDDAFSIDVERAKKICRRIIEEKLNNIHFMCQTRIDYADEELFSLFLEAGFKEVSFGLDTASPRVLNVIKKVRGTDGAADDYKKEKTFLERYKRNIKIAQSRGLETYVSIILGLPSETPEDGRQTLDFVKSIDVAAYTHNILQVFTGTEVSLTAEKHGMKFNSGPFLLPYNVEYTYDVYDMPMLENAAHRGFIAQMKSMDHDAFLKLSGIIEQRAETDAPVQVYFDRILQPSRQLCRWMTDTITLDTSVFFYNPASTRDEYWQRVQPLADALVPLRKYSQLRKSPVPAPGDTPGKEYSYELNDIFPEFKKDEYHVTFKIIPFNEAKNTTWKPGEIQIRRISDRQSFQAMVEEMEDIALFDVLDLANLLKEFYYIEDRCRWSQCLCRGIKLQSPIVDEEENIRPCLSGKTVGTTSESHGLIRERLKTLQGETETRRGCARCEVRYECSRCLFLPDFMTEKEYCEFRREYAALHRAVEAKQIAYLLMLQIKGKRIKALQVNELQISGLNSRMFYREETEEGTREREPVDSFIRKGFIMIRFNSDFFLYDINRVKLLRMSDKMAAIFEVLESRPFEPGYVKSWLADKYSLSGPEAEETLAAALKLFQELKVVSNA
jgi:radical SAM superfamily enzyme YgiQ (UPF0313 family)